MHRAPSPATEQPPGGGDSARRTPQPRLKLVGKGKRQGVGLGGAGLWKGVWRAEIWGGGVSRGREIRVGGWRLMELGGPWDLMNLDMKEYIQTLHPTFYFVGMTWLVSPLQRMWGAPKLQGKPWSFSWLQCGGSGGG